VYQGYDYPLPNRNYQASDRICLLFQPPAPQLSIRFLTRFGQVNPVFAVAEAKELFDMAIQWTNRCQP